MELLFDKYLESIKLNNSFNLGLTGGNTPKLIYKHLVSHCLQKFDWTKLKIFLVDDRCVPKDTSESKYNIENQMLFRYIPRVKLHRFMTELPGEEALNMYREYLAKNLYIVLYGYGKTVMWVLFSLNSYEEYTKNL